MDARGKYDFIQFIRGIAALMVLLEHLWPFARDILKYDSKLLDIFTAEIFNIGQIAVVLFFVITGFLVPWSCYEKSAKDFIIGRLFRIYPVYIVSILGLSIIAALLGRKYSAVEILANLTLFQMYMGIENINGASWVLPIDIIFYILCVVFKKYLRNTHIVLVGFYLMCAGTLGAAFLRGRMQRKLPVAILLLCTVAVLGYILRLYHEKRIEGNKVKVVVSIFFLVTFISAVTAYNFDTGLGEHWYTYFISYTLTTAFFIYLYKRQYHTSSQMILFVSKISYSLFLMHPVAFELFQIYKEGYIRSIFLVICISAAFTLAGISYYLIEAPCRKLLYLTKHYW